MAYDEGLAKRVRARLASRADVQEKRMFGGLTFMVRGKMCVGIVGEDLMVRVGADRHEELLREPHARPMDFTGRTPRGFLFVGAGGTRADEDLATWMDRALAYVESLPREE